MTTKPLDLARVEKIRTIKSLVSIHKHPPTDVVLKYAKKFKIKLTYTELHFITETNYPLR